MDTPQRLLLLHRTPTLLTLTLSGSTVAEDAAAATVVGTLVGQRAGSTVTISAQSNTGWFSLDTTTFPATVKVAGTLDFETNPSPTITVLQTYPGVAEKSTVLTITVTDVSEGEALALLLASYEAASKLLSSWFLPEADPDQYLTLNGASVEGWTAAYGTQKVDLAEVVAPPQWDATLYSNKGGVTFDGTTQYLTGTGLVTNWPGSTDSLWLLVAARQDFVAGVDNNNKQALSYGSGSASSFRAVGRSVPVDTNRARGSLHAGFNGATGVLSGSHTILLNCVSGGTSTMYFDGVSDATNATALGAITLTRVRMGSASNTTASFFWGGAIVGAAVMPGTVSEAEALALEALFRARLS